jgi:hypothetical protein
MGETGKKLCKIHSSTEVEAPRGRIKQEAGGSAGGCGFTWGADMATKALTFEKSLEGGKKRDVQIFCGGGGDGTQDLTYARQALYH